jgi:ribosomal protein S12 methylthiotransferase
VGVAFIQLGCPKNLVDGELMMGLAQRAGFRLVANPAEADIVVVNTCAFIREAQQEAIDEILEVGRLKTAGRVRRLVVSGCLSERHGLKLLREIPEIDGILGPGRIGRIVPVLDAVRCGEPEVAELGGFPSVYPEVPREHTGSPHTAYVKIAEGCDHGCAFCLIPRLRGPQRSRPPEKIAAEITGLVAAGVREVVLVAQDTTAYGRDLSERPTLADLLRRLVRLEGIEWLRVLYTHPNHWTEELIETFADGGPLLPYVDLPVQHISDRVLQAMGRGRSAVRIRRLIERLRRSIPGLVLRTTVMTGHPLEGTAEFADLLQLIREFPFDRLGAFAYSPEAGTRSARMRRRPSLQEAEKRRRGVLELQREVARELQGQRRGTCVRVLIEGVHPEHGFLVGRSYGEAPEIDGLVYVKGWRGASEWQSGRESPLGEFLAVRICAAGPYDLVGVPCGAEPPG